jgi:hypothetical protein
MGEERQFDSPPLRTLLSEDEIRRRELILMELRRVARADRPSLKTAPR